MSGIETPSTAESAKPRMTEAKPGYGRAWLLITTGVVVLLIIAAILGRHSNKSPSSRASKIGDTTTTIARSPMSTSTATTAAPAVTPTIVTTTPATTTTAVGSNLALSGMGELEAAWNASHVMQSGPGSSYGVQVPDGQGGFNPQWTSVQFGDGRVTGFIYAMPPGTSLIEAKQGVMQQLPSDAVTTSFQAVTDSSGNACAFWNLRSAALAQLVGPPPAGDTTGDIGVVLFTNGPNSSTTYDTSNIEVASISTTPTDPSNHC